MKYSILGAAAFALSALAAPLLDVEQTSVQFGREQQALDNGEITVQLTRIDDLIDENDNNKLLLERVSHIKLSIQLQPEQGCLSINDERLPLTGSDADATLHVVKAESYHLGDNLPTELWSAEGVESLVDNLSAGVVALSVRLTSEEVPWAVLAAEDGMGGVEAVAGISFRQLGVYIKIVEVEGVDLAHTSTVFAPILQLLVKTENPIEGQPKIVDVTTLSLAGQPTTQDAVLDTAGLPDVTDLLPAINNGEATEGEAVTPVWRPHHHHHEHSGFYNWLQSLFGVRRQPDTVREKAAQPMTTLVDNPRFRKGRPFAAQQHGQHMRGQRNCFSRRFVSGVGYVLVSAVAFFTQTAVGACLLGAMIGFMLGGMLLLCGHVLKLRQARQVRQVSEDEKYDSEKLVLVEEEDDSPLPAYDVHAETPLFDAEKEMME